ncbi:helix-turn-helix domain-containing protein [Chromohalobacter sp. 48-RD10]|uniref:winged helix-turn-helix transcriptional regulator n=1 Tax=Chromohalobacter sp. 48-RD10 TaxID=2994063 RepID=UPI002469AA06|nr:helix-turn-helix domain-containing protein [Chromohalobacter sp. 48-RD10]
MNEKTPASSPFICGLDATLHVIGGKWKPLILYFLAGGSQRYGELKRSVHGVSHKMLIQQLKMLERDGVVSRTDHGEIPPRVDYALTPLGYSLCEALRPLCSWGDQHTEMISDMIEKREEQEKA